MTRSLLTTIATTLVCVGPGRADDAERRAAVEKARADLVKAREAHKAAVTAARKEIARDVDDLDAEERRKPNPDLEKLKTYRAEKEALEQRGEFPRRFEFRARDRLTRAQAPLVAALVALKKAHLDARQDEPAAAVDRELEALKKAEVPLTPLPAMPRAVPTDPFVAGSVWRATGPKGATKELRVTKRDGDDIEFRYSGPANSVVVATKVVRSGFAWTDRDVIKVERGSTFAASVTLLDDRTKCEVDIGAKGKGKGKKNVTVVLTLDKD